MKSKKNFKKDMYKQNCILYSELAPLIRDVTCSKIWRDRINIVDKKLCGTVEHTPRDTQSQVL